MTKTALNPKVSRVTEPKTASVPQKKDEAGKTPESSTFKSVGKNKWSSMTKATETPSIIAEGLEAIQEAQPKSRREQTNARIGNFMLGDYGNIRQSEGKNVLFADHETIDIPSARDLFRDYSTLQDNTLPVLQRYIGLRGTIKDLIEVTTESINSIGLSAQEKQGNIDYLDYLYDRLHTVQNEIDVIENVRLNELHRRALDQDDVEEVKENMDAADNAFIDEA
jgi:hypothetical protein